MDLQGLVVARGGVRRRGTPSHRERGLGRGLCHSREKNEFFFEMACFGAFLAVFFVRVLARKMLNFPPEMGIWSNLKMYFWEIVNTLLELWD